MEKKSSPPKKLKIKGQPHKLAYINDVEEGLLRARGGSGEMVHGIPAFYDEGDDYSGPNATDADRGNNLGTTIGDDSGAEFGNNNAAQAISEANRVVSAQLALQDSLSRERAQRAAAGQNMVNTTRNPFANSALTAKDFAFNVTPNAQRIAQSYINSLGANGKNIFAPSVFSGRRVGGSIGNFLKGGGLNSLRGTSLYSNYFDDPAINTAIGQAAINQISGSNRGTNAKDGYGMPVGSTMLGAVGGYNVQNIQDKIAAGGRPVFDENGVVQGVFHKGLFGGEVYSGNPVDGIEGTGGVEQDDNDGAPTPIENPLTGEKQCPEGYFFDEDLQSCRMGSASDNGGGGDLVTAPAAGAYYRPTGLETASAFTPAGFDYDAANSAFLDSYAYRPDNYRNQMSLNGFKKIT